MYPPGSSGPEIEFTKTEERFDLDVAGRSWSGIKRTYTMEDGQVISSYIADDGWFGGLVRADSGVPGNAETLFDLTAFGTEGALVVGAAGNDGLAHGVQLGFFDRPT